MKRTAAAELSDHRKNRRKRESEINKGLRDLGEAGALDLLRDLCDKWQLTEQGRSLTFEEQTMRMFQRFGMDYRDTMLDSLEVDRGSFGLRALDDRINEAELQAIGLYHRMHELGLLPEGKAVAPDDGDRGGGDRGEDDGEDEVDPVKKGNLKKVVKVLEMVFYAKKVVLSAFQAKLAIHQMHLDDGTLDLAADLDARLGSWALRFRYIENKTTPMQNLLLYLLDGAMEKRYRKSNGWMYEPIYLNGTNMHAWRPVCEIKSFVYGMLHKEVCWEQWCNATAMGMKNIVGAIEYLTNCQDYQLPELHKQRGVYSFTNGVYLASEDRFHRFAAAAQPLSEDVVACKFIDGEFNDYADLDDWRSIPTPHLQGIMDYQAFPHDVCDWLYVLLGRLLYPLNQVDSWQVIPFFKGAAASGKSTIILKVAKMFYEAMDVGVLSNNIERKFGLSAFHDKYLFVAPEVKSDMCLEQAEFQSVVSGEDLQVNVKHKQAFSTTWSVPGALAGNEVPSWADNSGSVQRRVIVFEFARTVLNGDMKLGDKLETELPALIAKCNRAYLEMARRHSHANLWTVLPAYFRATRDQLAQSVNSVEAFLASTEVVHGPDMFCPMADFRNALKAFEQSNNYKSKKYDTDFFRGPFAKFNVRIERVRKEYRGVANVRDYVFGIDLNDGVGGEDNALG